jgi:hypothetical protein
MDLVDEESEYDLWQGQQISLPSTASILETVHNQIPFYYRDGSFRRGKVVGACTYNTISLASNII